MNSTRSPSRSSKGSGVAARAGRQSAVSSANLASERVRPKRRRARVAPGPPECCRHLAGRFCQRDAGSVFSVLAVPVAQTCSLLYRRFLTCQLPPASNVLPITNRRYGRLKICATANRYDAGSTPSGRRYVRPNLKPRWFAGSLQAILASSDQSLVVLILIVLATR